MRQLVFLFIFFFLAISAMAQTYTSGLTSTGSGSNTNVRLGGANPLLVNTTVDLGTFTFGFKKSSANYFTILNNGNIGIGNASPTSLLHLKAGTASSNTAPLKFTSGVNLSSPEAGAMEFNGSSLFFTPSTARLEIAFADLSNITGTLLVTKGGTGVSTLATGDILYASAANTLARLAKGTDGQFLTLSLGVPTWSSPTTGWGLTGNSGTNSATNFIGTTDNTSFAFRTNNTEKLRIDAAGNIGIGNTTPTYKLDVNGTVRITSDMLVNGMSFGLGAGAVSTNTMLGYQAGQLNTTGSDNNFIGYQAGTNNTTGSYNYLFGNQAGINNTTGSYNSFISYRAGYYNTAGNANNFIGYSAGFTNTSGSYNNFIGSNSGYSNTTGNGNVFISRYTGLSNTTGNYNSVIGYGAGYNNTTGSYNSMLGYEAGRYIANGSAASIINNSIFIGTNTKALADNGTNEIVIGYNATGLGSNTVVLGNNNIVLTSLKGQVGINNSTPATSAQFDISSTTKGFKPPVMTNAQMQAISAPIAGLMVANSDSSNRVFSYDGSNWKGYSFGADNQWSNVTGGIRHNGNIGINYDPNDNGGNYMLGVGGAVLASAYTTFAGSSFSNSGLYGSGAEFSFKYWNGSSIDTAMKWNNTGIISIPSQMKFGIGTATPHSSAILEISSTTKGFLPPRLTTSQMNLISNPASGLLITNTDSSNRLFIYTGSAWKGLKYTDEGGAGGGDFQAITNIGNTTSNSITVSSNLKIWRGLNNLSYNIGIGEGTLTSLTGSAGGLAIGNDALKNNTSGSNNTAVGYQSLTNNTTGGWNSAYGLWALRNNTTGNSNTAIGFRAMEGSYIGITGDANTSIGANTLDSLTSGRLNAAIGYWTMLNTTSGSENTAFGTTAMRHNTTGNYNSGFGRQALWSNSVGHGNTALGSFAGYNALGGGNVFLGYQAGYNETGSNKLYIANTSGSVPLIYGDFATGMVGIGTKNVSDTNYKLFVETGIRTRKIKVDALVWSDYVFDNDYKLPSLTEVENYIQKNKHLPGVQSATEVEKNGIDLAETDATLLKKVEELTLYMIELNKKVECLAKENELLKQKMATSK